MKKHPRLVRLLNQIAFVEGVAILFTATYVYFIVTFNLPSPVIAHQFLLLTGLWLIIVFLGVYLLTDLWLFFRRCKKNE